MIIGIDASRANRREKSGVEWYAYHLLHNLYNIDFKNQYFLFTEDELQPNLTPASDNFKSKVLKWPLKRFWTLGRLSLEMMFNKPDILFVPSHTFPIIPAKKNIITWHDVGYEKYPETYSKWEITSLRRGAKKAFKIADKIITISEFTKNEIVNRHQIDPKRVEVIHLGCNHERWNPQPETTVKEFLKLMEIKNPYFLYIGRLNIRKNIVGLIRSYNRFREKSNTPHNLILVGSEGVDRSDINAEIIASPYRQEIKKLGWLPIEQLPILLSGAVAAIYPSFYEGFGLPVIEAMACGCPVITSTSGSLPEIVGGAALSVDAHDIDGFAEKMKEIGENEILREENIRKGFDRSAHFKWENTAKQTLKVFESV